MMRNLGGGPLLSLSLSLRSLWVLGFGFWVTFVNVGGRGGVTGFWLTAATVNLGGRGEGVNGG